MKLLPFKAGRFSVCDYYEAKFVSTVRFKGGRHFIPHMHTHTYNSNVPTAMKKPDLRQ